MGGEVAFQADINAMFNQIFVTREHWNLMRFLWFKDDNLDGEIEECQLLHNFFGGTQAPGHAGYAVRKTCLDNADFFHPEVINTGLRNMYVDDLLKSMDMPTAKIVMAQVFDLFDRGGFELAKVVTTHKELLELVKPDRIADSMKELELGQHSEGRVLGVAWDANDDTFGFKVREKERTRNRRGLLGYISAMYDPEGSVAPVILVARQLLQKLTAEGIGWDEDLPEKEAKEMQDWLESLKDLETLKRDRYIVPKGFGKIVKRDLHAFSDGSESGCGFAVYVRSENAEGQVHVSFLFAKALVTPKKTNTIPRIELQALLLSMRGLKFILEESDVKYHALYQWTDSTAVLAMLKNTQRRFQTFVANRLQKTRDLQDELDVEVRHIPGEMNIADICSRGLTVERFLKCEEYFAGPQFPYSPESSWPKCPTIQELPDDHTELKKATVFATTVVLVQQDPLIRMVERTSRWTTLKTSVAWINRFQKWAQETRCGKYPQSYSGMKGNISAQEMRWAERDIITYVQGIAFQNDIQRIRKVGPRMAHTELQKLYPFLDERGTMRVGGRLTESSLPYSERHQMILPKKHHLTDIIVRHYHEMYQHAPPKTLLYLLRKRFWVICGSSVTYKTQRNCIQCIRALAIPRDQLQGILPAARVAVGNVWHETGCDVMGPVLIKILRSEVKRYILGLVSFTVKSVHFEVLPDLTVPTFLNAMRRFIARRSRPQKLTTDCAGTFSAGVREINELQDLYNKSTVEDFMRQREIEWVANTPKASHRNGLFERPFRTLRRVMLGTFKGRVMTEDQLATAVAECEYLYNSRPICASSSSPQDPQPLTPNQILNPEPSEAYSPGVFVEKDLIVRDKFRQVQAIINTFWKRFRTEYLTSLQERTKSITERRNYKIGDLVIICDEMKSAHRGHYPMGVITDVNYGSDQRVRTVEIKTANNTFSRPVNKICLLEAEDYTED